MDFMAFLPYSGFYRREKRSFDSLRRFWMRQGDSRRAAGRHVAHHYDLPHEHYRRFLDADLQYSCAYFADPSFSLEQAQEAKKRYISQACIRPRTHKSGTVNAAC
jgi:cyclopropane-fatty-acyl-phospholipid synthase